ncbi:hypothetical protein [Candidatus Accumulibacter sp. ACC012]|uniref:hypothetical protein n=1 Tax=Candidatus Accumulibacter sp. ACC012 TaxID=2823332 RepID=UPI003439F375
MVATSAGNWVHCGRVFRATEIADLCATVAWLPGLARKELAATVCEHLGWTTRTGTAKLSACLEFLERLQAAGLLALPAVRPSPAGRGAAVAAPVEPVAEPPVHGTLSALGPVSLEVVRDPAVVAHWDALVAPWHPQGLARTLGVPAAAAGKLCRPATPCRHLLPCCRLAVARRDQRTRAGPPWPALAGPGRSYHSTPRQVWVKPLGGDGRDRLCAVTGISRP